MWNNSDLLRHMIGDAEETGAITLTCVSEHCKLFVVEDLSWWCHYQPRRKEETQHAHFLQVGDSVHEHIAFSACAAPDGDCDNLVCVHTN